MADKANSSQAGLAQWLQVKVWSGFDAETLRFFLLLLLSLRLAVRVHYTPVKFLVFFFLNDQVKIFYHVIVHACVNVLTYYNELLCRLCTQLFICLFLTERRNITLPV